MENKKYVNTFEQHEQNHNDRAYPPGWTTSLTDFKPYVVAGFTLAGYKTNDGFILGDKKNGDFVKNLPKLIKCNSVIYTLENVETHKNNFFNANYV